MGVSRRSLLGGFSGVVFGGLSGCVSNSVQPTGDVTIRITQDQQFEPNRIDIERGSTVVWSHEGRGMHSVTAFQDSIPDPDAYFASGGATSEFRARLLYPLVGALAPGDGYANPFEIRGSYRYFSIPGEDIGMTGEITVV